MKQIKYLCWLLFFFFFFYFKFPSLSYHHEFGSQLLLKYKIKSNKQSGQSHDNVNNNVYRVSVQCIRVLF